MGIRRQLRQRLDEIASSTLGDALDRKMEYIATSRARPIAIETASANKQHYEVGTGVYVNTLGPRMKYSSCLYPKGTETLGEAEVAMLRAYVERAELKDGMRILDLGWVWSYYLSALSQFPSSPYFWHCDLTLADSPSLLAVAGAQARSSSPRCCQMPR